MTDFDDLYEELKQKRDELRVQINLASKEARDEWQELEEKMDEFADRAKAFADDARIKESGEGVGKAMLQVGEEIKRGYERIWDAMKKG